MRTNTQTRHILKEEKGSILVGAVVLTIVLVVTGFAFLLYVSHATSSMNQSIGIGQEVLQARSAWQSAQYGFHTGTLLPGDGITYDYVKEYIDLKDNKSKYKDTDGESLAWVKVEVRFVEEDDEFFGFATSVRFYYDILSFSGFNWGSLPPYVRMRIADQRTTMADYLYLSDSELNPYFQTPIYFWQEDTLDGKVHSNGKIYTLNDPVFFKTISSCSSYIYPMYGNQGVYLGSPPQRLSVSNIEFPYTAVELREAAWEAGAVLFNPETNTCPPGYFIRGIPDGYTTQVLISGTQVGYKFLPYIEDSLNLDWARETFPVWVGAVNQNDYYGGTPVFVEGFGGNPADVWINSETGFPVVADEYGIKQRITVGCNGSILIDGPLVYNGVGLVNVVPQNCVHSLGLISENWVWLSKSAPYNAYIHGGIIALDSCFSVHGVYDYTAPVRNSISLFGCVAQKNRGTVHRGNGGPPSETGYRQKDYSYDQRFTYRPPPYFITIGHSYTLFDIQEYWDLDYLSEIFDL